MDEREPPAVRVDGQVTAWRDIAVADERAAFALPAEAEVFKKQNRVDGKGVIQLHDVNVAWSNAGHLVGATSRLR